MVPLPGRRSRAALPIPSGRSILIGFGILAAVVGAYVGARETSAFAVREIQVEGAGPALAGRIRDALEPVVGRSLVALDGEDVVARLEAIPQVRSAQYDRAFPNTLVVAVQPERPAAVLRRGRESWLLSARGRVVRPLDRGAHPRLPRIWVPRTVEVAPGAVLAEPEVSRAVVALRPLAAEGLPVRVRAVRAREGRLVFVLASGLELRLGDATELALKLAVARRVLPVLAAGTLYLDVSVPERPVAGSTLDSKVEVES